MSKQQRYKQATKEAKITLILAVLYVFGWCLCAYLPADTHGPLGFPLWFELACIYLPMLFIVVGYWTIRIFFQEISLEKQDDKEKL
ncbi:YhdT family protein [Gallibacterium trehalosifermentans]|uniref:YhdT family protein n=1 Tax=Gallibacterium trehalosifermentans TaxID=516935 RepID=A0ABV6H018_9PAST